MSRKIKFRFWDDVNQKMIFRNSLYELQKYQVHPELNDTAMQFTGLKDKNGVDIYEGDVVYIGGYGLYECELPFLELYDAVMENDIGEIVGNIHENPELLIWNWLFLSNTASRMSGKI